MPKCEEFMTDEEEQAEVVRVKQNLRDLLEQTGSWKGFENEAMTVYALLEVAIEIADDVVFFLDVAGEVAEVYRQGKNRITDYCYLTPKLNLIK